MAYSYRYRKCLRMADFQIIKQKLMLYYVRVFLIRNIIFQILMTYP